MRAFVFTDKALAKHAGQFVWLSIDTEKAQNAAFSRRYPIRAWPSLYVIDPAKEKIALRWVGGATVAEIETILRDGARAAGDQASTSPALARAEALYSEGKYAEAAPAYREALRSMPKDAPEYPRALESLLFSLASTDQNSECASVAREELATVRHTAAAVVVAGGGLDCALKLPADAPSRTEILSAFETEARSILSDGKLKLLADDRSALYGSLVDAREDAKDAEGAARLAGEWVANLDGEASRAKTPEQRTALDPNRLSAFQAAGALEKAIPMLDQSEKDFPADYNPPARLAYVYLHLKRYAEARPAADRALARVYGPRRIRVLLTLADIQKGQGDAAAARQTLEDALAFAQELPEGQRSEEQIASLKKKLEPAAAPP
ncbi:MAG: tetratricopeptide repeat protein [Acidobacteriota bacterium]